MHTDKRISMLHAYMWYIHYTYVRHTARALTRVCTHVIHMHTGSHACFQATAYGACPKSIRASGALAASRTAGASETRPRYTSACRTSSTRSRPWIPGICPGQPRWWRGQILDLVTTYGASEHPCPSPLRACFLKTTLAYAWHHRIYKITRIQPKCATMCRKPYAQAPAPCPMAHVCMCACMYLWNISWHACKELKMRMCMLMCVHLSSFQIFCWIMPWYVCEQVLRSIMYAHSSMYLGWYRGTVSHIWSLICSWATYECICIYVCCVFTHIIYVCVGSCHAYTLSDETDDSYFAALHDISMHVCWHVYHVCMCAFHMYAHCHGSNARLYSRAFYVWLMYIYIYIYIYI